MYTNLKMYLRPDLDLKSKLHKHSSPMDVLVSQAYYAVVKSSVEDKIKKIINYQYTLVNRHGNVVKATLPSKVARHKRQKQKALDVCQFILDNFETIQRNKRSNYVKRWCRKNPDKVNNKSKVSGKKRKLRVPKWLTKEQIAYMDAVHMEAKALRKGGLNVHVDHIIPLCGDNISGLHVPENLEIVPASDNLLKNNSWEVA